MRTHQFLPDSPCELACIPADEPVPRVGRPRYALRRAALAGTYLLAKALGLLTTLCTEPASRRLLRLWARMLVRATGCRVRVTGAAGAARPALVVANHASQLDATALLALEPMVVVAADDARRDPVVGRFARNSGAIFVERSTASLPAMVERATAALRAGTSVLVFPEGRIRCRAPGGPFRPGAMQAAIDARAPVRPVLVRYRLGDGRPAPHASWLGEETLPMSLSRVMRIRGMTVDIHVFPDLDTAVHRDRKALARAAKEPIDAAAGVPSTCAAGRR